MAGDYKHRAAPREEPPRGRPAGLIWFGAGLLTGLFGAGLVWLKLGAPPPAAPQPQALAKAAAERREAAAAQPPKPHYSFYNLLPEMEVVIPEEELVDPEPAPPRAEPGANTAAPAATAPVTTATVEPAAARPRYILQMGSFQKYADADRLKARLALLGIEAEIQRVEVSRGKIFHRVRSTPIDGRAELESRRSQLARAGIKPLIIKAN